MFDTILNMQVQSLIYNLVRVFAKTELMYFLK